MTQKGNVLKREKIEGWLKKKSFKCTQKAATARCSRRTAAPSTPRDPQHLWTGCQKHAGSSLHLHRSLKEATSATPTSKSAFSSSYFGPAAALESVKTTTTTQGHLFLQAPGWKNPPTITLHSLSCSDAVTFQIHTSQPQRVSARRRLSSSESLHLLLE